MIHNRLIGRGPLRRTAVVLALATLLGGSLATAGRAYQVAAGSKGNTIHMMVDDRVGLTPGARMEAQVVESPAWLAVQGADLRTERLVDLAIRFDVAAVDPGTKGHIKVRLTGIDASGRTTFDRTHFISLVVRRSVEPVQQSFAIEECCPVAAGLDDSGVAPAAATLLGPIPNPFLSMTNIVFGLPVAGGHALLEIFDIEGRQVRSIETPRLNGGYHRITWDGRNDEGLDVSPGTYFCRLSCGSWSATTKTQLLR